MWPPDTPTPTCSWSRATAPAAPPCASTTTAERGRDARLDNISLPRGRLHPSPPTTKGPRARRQLQRPASTQVVSAGHSRALEGLDETPSRGPSARCTATASATGPPPRCSKNHRSPLRGSPSPGWTSGGGAGLGGHAQTRRYLHRHPHIHPGAPTPKPSASRSPQNAPRARLQATPVTAPACRWRRLPAGCAATALEDRGRTWWGRLYGGGEVRLLRRRSEARLFVVEPERPPRGVLVVLGALPHCGGTLGHGHPWRRSGRFSPRPRSGDLPSLVGPRSDAVGGHCGSSPRRALLGHRPSAVASAVARAGADPVHHTDAFRRATTS